MCGCRCVKIWVQQTATTLSLFPALSTCMQAHSQTPYTLKAGKVPTYAPFTLDKIRHGTARHQCVWQRLHCNNKVAPKCARIAIKIFRQDGDLSYGGISLLELHVHVLRERSIYRLHGPIRLATVYTDKNRGVVPCQHTFARRVSEHGTGSVYTGKKSGAVLARFFFLPV